MYAYIKGTLEDKSNTYVVVECMGIGYKIFMSNTSISNLGELGEKVKIYTHYYVREDNISLYGFNTKEELRMFELLISVSGVGAKSALVMLSCIEPSEFAIAVISNNVKLLTQVPGIGPKSALRIILELKDKLKAEQSELDEEKIESQKLNSIKVSENIQEATSGLMVLGYTRKDIEKAFKHLDVENLSVEDLIKKGLILLTTK